VIFHCTYFFLPPARRRVAIFKAPKPLEGKIRRNEISLTSLTGEIREVADFLRFL